MKHLTLIRHAKSSWDDPSLADFDRPLNKRGEKNAPEMGRRLLERGIHPDAIVTSPARRAKRTSELIAMELGSGDNILHHEEKIYAADPETLIEVIQALDDAWNDVFLVGHNPGFTDLANLLTPTYFENIPTCGVLRLELPISSWSDARPGQAVIAFYDVPQKKSGQANTFP